MAWKKLCDRRDAVKNDNQLRRQFSKDVRNQFTHKQLILPNIKVIYSILPK